MGLLDLLKKEDSVEEFPLSLGATANGTIVEMKDIPDDVFAQGMVGPCIGIEPSNGTIVAPCDGKILQLSDTLHAFGLEGIGGVQILVHIGIDTVSMNGDGFTTNVKVGDKVKKGQPIINVDLEKVKAAGHPTVVITIVSNPNNYTDITFTNEPSVKTVDELISINK